MNRAVAESAYIEARRDRTISDLFNLRSLNALKGMLSDRLLLAQTYMDDGATHTAETILQVDVPLIRKAIADWKP